MYPLTLGVVISSRSLLDEVQGCIFDLPVRVVLDQPRIDDWAEFLDKLERAQPDVLLVELTELADPLAEVVRQIKATSSHPAVVVVHQSGEAETILKAIRASADEFLFPPLTKDLRGALERLSTTRTKAKAGTKPRGKSFGFLSSKGGCGATTIACHVATELYRQTNLQVLLADFDLETGMAGFLLKSQCRYSVVDAVENIHRLDLSFWKALVANGSGGVEVIMSPGAPFVSRDRTIEDFRGVIRFARSMYDWTVVDLGRGLTLMAKAVIEEIDDLFIITPLEVPALHQTKSMIRSLSELGYPSHRMHVLINRMPKRSEITLDELESMLGVAVYGTLPSDYPSLYEAYSEGQMLSPNSKLGKSITNMTTKLAGLEEAPKKKFLFAF